MNNGNKDDGKEGPNLNIHKGDSGRDESDIHAHVTDSRSYVDDHSQRDNRSYTTQDNHSIQYQVKDSSKSKTSIDSSRNFMVNKGLPFVAMVAIVALVIIYTRPAAIVPVHQGNAGAAPFISQPVDDARSNPSSDSSRLQVQFPPAQQTPTNTQKSNNPALQPAAVDHAKINNDVLVFPSAKAEATTVPTKVPEPAPTKAPETPPTKPPAPTHAPEPVISDKAVLFAVDLSELPKGVSAGSAFSKAAQILSGKGYTLSGGAGSAQCMETAKLKDLGKKNGCRYAIGGKIWGVNGSDMSQSDYKVNLFFAHGKFELCIFDVKTGQMKDLGSNSFKVGKDSMDRAMAASTEQAVEEASKAIGGAL